MIRIIFWSIVYLIAKVNIADGHPKNLLDEDNCNIEKSTRSEDDISTPWTSAVVSCPGLNYITVALCPHKCHHPKTGRILNPRRFVSKNVTYLVELRDLDGRKLAYEVPLACKCVSRARARASVSKCRRRRPIFRIFGDLLMGGRSALD